ncbi:hypothetical protein AVEN_175248-1 [Araneus ventricosus]|uniref:Uncharacterized protein n=1 Tax=Araneus ventricosus TaxID=182803 RepID=A0A4Y2LH95_ARAVE|nr:hypothetical protein AVEN_175248-1 [Araneus ventricosus]
MGPDHTVTEDCLPFLRNTSRIESSLLTIQHILEQAWIGLHTHQMLPYAAAFLDTAEGHFTRTILQHWTSFKSLSVRHVRPFLLAYHRGCLKSKFFVCTMFVHILNRLFC